MLINFISNLPADLRSGGFSAMNVAACEAIGKAHKVHYAGPINPPAFMRQKVISKALRSLRLPGDYFFFSKTRLCAISGLAGSSCQSGAGMDFFHGFTPWIKTRPARPYVAWSDCTFRDYISLYHQRADFRAADLARIEGEEAEWLRGARAIGFTSEWAAARATHDYKLDPARVHVVGIFGEAELPEVDAYGGERQFAFVSTDFVAKGGPQVLNAFRAVRARHADATLVIVGDAPGQLNTEPGVRIEGFLRKEDPEQNQRLRDILASSLAIVHPTRSDIAPLLLVEAGYFGLPVISSRRFAIPEIVEHGVTGILLDDPQSVSAIAAAMAAMLEMQPPQYLALRETTWRRSREQHSRDRFDSRLLAMIESARQHRP